MKRIVLLFVIACSALAIPAKAQTVTDNFSGTGALSSNWTNIGTVACNQFSGYAAPVTSGSQCAAIYTGVSFPADEYVEATVSWSSSCGSSGSGLTMVDNTNTGYIWLFCGNSAGTNGDIYIITSGSGVGPVGGYSGCPVVNSGDRIKLQRVGNQFSCIDITTGQSGGPYFDNTHTAAVPLGMNIDQGSVAGLHFASFQAGAFSSISASPTTLVVGSTGNSVALTGTNTVWTPGTPGSPTFTVSGTSGCSITAQTVASATSATLTITAGASPGTCIINDPSSLNSATITVRTLQTWYIRLGGGTATQCTGHTNANYPGSGTGQACALNHPFWLMQTNGQWRTDYGGGDTVQFEDSGPYYWGTKGTSGFGTDWNALGYSNCAPSVAYACTTPSLPPGSAAHPTKWLGVNAGACHIAATGTPNPNRFNLNSPTQFIVINGVFTVFDIARSSYADVECIQIASRESCIYNKGGGASTSIVGTSLASNTASYQWRNGGGELMPLAGEHVRVIGTTNNGGSFNGNYYVATDGNSVMNITASQSDGSTATFTYNVASGIAPVNGDRVVVRNTTNCSGQLNGIFDLPVGSVTGTTFQVSFSSVSCTSASESGTAQNNSSGIFTVTGLPSGTVALQAESGSEDIYGRCGNASSGGPNTNDFGVIGIAFQEQNTSTQGPDNFTLKDIEIENMEDAGVIGSHINKTGTDVSTASYLKIIGNPYSGWNADSGLGGTCCESVGTLNMDHVMMDFNGAAEFIPTGGYSTSTGLPINGFNYGYAQSTGGYGDGFAQIAAGDFTLNLTHTEAEFNTQDGFDLLHLGDDSSHSQNLVLTNDWSEGNMGQAYKVGGAANVTMEDDVSIANCAVMFYGATTYMGTFAQGWNAGLQFYGDFCRAAEDQITLFPSSGHTITLIHNTVAGYGATMYYIDNNNGPVVFKNNISVGYTNPYTGNVAAGFYFNSGDPFGVPGGNISYNNWYGMRSGTCPQDGTYETNYQCGSPMLNQQANVNALDPTLTSGSSTYVTGKGTAAGPTTDFNGNLFGTPPSIGAYEFMSAPPPTSSILVNGHVVFHGTIIIK